MISLIAAVFPYKLIPLKVFIVKAAERLVVALNISARGLILSVVSGRRRQKGRQGAVSCAIFGYGREAWQRCSRTTKKSIWIEVLVRTLPSKLMATKVVCKQRGSGLGWPAYQAAELCRVITCKDAF